MTRVFLAYSHDRDRELVAALKDKLREVEGISLLDPASSLVSGAEIASEIRAQIEGCDVFLSVVGLDRPNILLETGMAIGSGKPLLLAAESAEPLPVNLRALPIVVLSGDPKADASSIARRLIELKSSTTDAGAEGMSALEQLKSYRSNPRFFDTIPPQRFEELIAEIFEQQGFEVTLTGRTYDAGFDIVVQSPRDRLQIAIQVKKYSRQSRVSIAQVRELLGAAVLMEADVAVLLTSSAFTAGAQALANEVTRPRLVLVTMDRFLESQSMGDLWGESANKAVQSGRPAADG